MGGWTPDRLARACAGAVMAAAAVGGIAWSVQSRPAPLQPLAPIHVLGERAAQPEARPAASGAAASPLDRPLGGDAGSGAMADASGITRIAPGSDRSAPTERGRTGETKVGAAQLRKSINLNTATKSELELLPGIGPALAQRILDHRAKVGRFSRVEQLDEVKGIGPSKMAKLAGLVTVE